MTLKKSMSVPLDELAPLYKASGGKTMVWQIAVEAQHDSADIVVTYGYEDGVKQTTRETIAKGKNIGKINETTALWQALSEAKSRWTRQLERKGYGLTREASAATRAIAPMLAYTYEDHRKKVDWLAAFTQPKLDGFRCLASRTSSGQAQLRSREGKPITAPEHIVAAVADLLRDSPSMILDGELYIHGVGDFGKISSAIRKAGPLTPKLVYHVYDCVSEAPFEERYNAAKLAIYGSPSCIVPVETVMVTDEDELMRCQKEFIEDGYEGAMLRHGTAGYAAGKRSSNLLKAKTFLDADFVVADIKEGRGTHAGMAIFTCQTPDGHDFDVLAPGSHEEKRAIWANWQEYLGRKVTVSFQELTKTEEPVPRFPVALRVL